jgi:small GTP-binding protein
MVMIGSSGVGKTSIVERLFCGKCFNEEQQPTIGGNFIINKFPISEDNTVDIHVWDTGGQERFYALMPMYIRGANIVVFVWDVNEPDSWQDLVRKWLPLVRLYVGKSVLYYTLSNKIDHLSDDLHNLSDDLYNLSDDLNNLSNTFFISAKTKEGTKAFLYQLKADIENYYQQMSDLSSEEEDENVNLIQKNQRNRCC